MRADRQAAGVGGRDRAQEAGRVVAATDAVEGAVAGGLQTDLEPDQPLPGELLQQVQHRLADAVRPGPDREPHDAVDLQRLPVDGPQAIDRRVGVRERLEVGDEAPGACSAGPWRLFPASICCATESPRACAPVPEPRALQ